LFVRNRDAKPTLDDNRIVVVPFRVSGADSSVKYLGEGIVDLIAPMLTGEGGPSAVDARTAISTWKRVTLGREGTINDARQVARELGAGLVLSGSIVEVAGKLTITGNILSGKSGEIRQLTSVTASADSIDTLLDRFVGQLLARQSGVAETSLTAVTSQSLPAIRAYLSGRAAYRKADEEGAIAAYARALDLDSTFALAALDLVVATEQLMRTQICREGSCRVYSQVPGFTSSIRSDDLFNRAVTLAWNYRSKLGKRDLPLLAAFRGRNFPGESSARETLEGLNRAVAAAPDRPESHYLLGVLLLYQGPALGLSDARTRAAAAFREAIRLDSTYLGPRARLVDIDAFEFNAENLRRDGLNYLAYDNAGPTAEYVRWLVSSAGADGAVQNIAPAPLRSLSAQTLEQIFTTSQMAGLRLEDADSVVKIMAENATDPIEKSVWFGRAYQLALNRGRPSEATESIRRMNDLRKPSYVFPRFAISAAVFDDGDRAAADSSSRTLAAKLERDTLEILAPDQIRPINGAMAMQALWYLEKGDTVAASRASDWLRRHSAGGPSAGVLAFLPEMQLASRTRHPDGAPLRARVDSILRDGCCQLPDIVGIALERAYAQSGDPAAALRVVRRGIWYQPPRGLATYLRDEGRLSTKLGDREGAIKAYKHFLALRSNPERSLRAATDSVRAELKRLEGAR
jgi:Predicted integral membrane protein